MLALGLAHANPILAGVTAGWPAGIGGYNVTVDKRRMCPNCRAFITTSDRVCPYCGVQLGPRAVDVRASQLASSFVPSTNFTSILILVINAAFFLMEVAISYRFSKSMQVSAPVMVLLGAKYGPLIHVGQYWRLITAGFLHGGFVHIFMNSWSLLILVTEVEQFYGTSRLIVAYIVSTITGFLCSYLWAPQTLSLGASAACFGLIGIMIAMGLRRRADPLSQAVRSHYGQWLIIGVVLSLLPGIDLAAHVGGFIGGLLVGLVAGLPGLPGTPKETLWRVLAGLALAVMLWAWVQDLRSYQVLVRSISL